MKNWFKKLCVGFMIIFVATMVSCEPPVVEKVGGSTESGGGNSTDSPFKTVKKTNQNQSAPSGFPVNREITDIEGRRVLVTIIGRDAAVVQFNRQSDGKRFDLPLDRLSTEDRAYIEKLPLIAVPAPVVVIETPRYIKVREQDIIKLENEIKLKTAELKAGQLSSILQNSRRRQIKDLEAEIKDLKLDIETYKHNNKLN